MEDNLASWLAVAATANTAGNEPNTAEIDWSVQILTVCLFIP